jgi:hypothetical protein
MTVPAYLPYYIFAGGVGIITAILLGLRLALAKANWPQPDRGATLRTASLILIGWFLVAIALGGLGVYQASSDRLPTIQYGILLPILIGGALLWRSSTLGRIIDAVPLPWLVGVQLYRALGTMFLILYANNKLPALFAWPAGIGDILVGVLAPLVALIYARAPREGASLVLGWNVLGILDLVVAVSTGFITAPSPFLPHINPPTSELMSVLPLVVIPTFAVPISILLHIATLMKLRRTAADSICPAEAATAHA